MDFVNFNELFRFNYSNTKILDQESSYWAEQIPVTNAPLCAVIDPVHGHRWHGLHCGGPEVAAFFCELQGMCDRITNVAQSSSVE